ncbi:uridine kinase [Blastococcus aurantiacus]|uniref:uridine kinase n=1 Tax=Blastococcus aurantiacus TaxID=1550231 RepID=UPI00115FA0BE|nr:uridine kinase [Blastococcus aurantiacus]
MVAVDGVDGSGKTVFADQLAAAIDATGRPVIRASVDDFHHARAERYRRGRTSPEGFWLDSYDYAALGRELLDPLRDGAPVRLRWHDLAADRHVDEPPAPTPPRAVVVIDGIFLHRDELAGRWGLSVWLDVPFAVTAARMALRDGSPAHPGHPAMRRYVGGQLLYFAACAPWERADLVVDNTDWTTPRLVRRPTSDR